MLRSLQVLLCLRILRPDHHNANQKGCETSMQKKTQWQWNQQSVDLVAQCVACAKGVPLSGLPINIFRFLADAFKAVFTNHNFQAVASACQRFCLYLIVYLLPYIMIWVVFSTFCLTSPLNCWQTVFCCVSPMVGQCKICHRSDTELLCDWVFLIDTSGKGHPSKEDEFSETFWEGGGSFPKGKLYCRFFPF